MMATTTPPVVDLDLPESDALDALLAEQETFDAVLAADPEGYEHQLDKTALEGRADIPALTRLQHERRVLVRALAPLAVLFEGGQTSPAEAKRKQHRQIVGTLIAAEQNLDGDRQETKLERLANADPRHVEFCEGLDRLRARYYAGRVALKEKDEEIRDREYALLAYNAELRAGMRGGGQV